MTSRMNVRECSSDSDARPELRRLGEGRHVKHVYSVQILFVRIVLCTYMLMHTLKSDQGPCLSPSADPARCLATHLAGGRCTRHARSPKGAEFINSRPAILLSHTLEGWLLRQAQTLAGRAT